MNCANLISNGPIFAVAGRIFPFPARNRRARAPDATGALPAEARQAVDIPAAALNSAPGAPPRYPEAAMSRFVPQPNSAAASPSSGPVRIDKGAATARSRSGPAGHKKGRIPLQEFSLVRLGCDDYLISMRRDAGAFSSTFFLGMSMVITPCSTLAEIFSVSTLSGSNRLCWKRLYENSRRR